MEAAVVLRITILLTGVVFVIYIAVGLLIAHVVLIATGFGLRNSEEQWVLGLMFGWYCFTMLGSIAAIWLHYKKITRAWSRLARCSAPFSFEIKRRGARALRNGASQSQYSRSTGRSDAQSVAAELSLGRASQAGEIRWQDAPDRQANVET